MMTILHGDNRFYNNIFVQYYPVDNNESKESPYYQVVGNHVWDQAVSSTLFLPASSFCLKRPLALKPGIEVDSNRLDTLVLGLV